MEFIYFGVRYSWARTNGNFGTFTCLTSEMGCEWDAIKAALDSGENVSIRLPTSVESECMQATMATYLANGGCVDDSAVPQVYH